MEENVDATMRANELRPWEKSRIHVAGSRFRPRSNQQREIFFQLYILVPKFRSLLRYCENSLL